MAAPSKKIVYKRVLRQLRPYRALVVLTIALALVTVAGNLWLPIIFGDVIDLIISQGNVDFTGEKRRFADRKTKE